MADSWTAHREERRLLGIDFSQDVPSSAVISAVDDFYVLNAAGNNVTAEFRGGSPAAFSINGFVVSFWKEIAASGEQLVGRYRVRCRVTVDNGEKPIALDSADKLIFLRIVGD